MLKKGGDLRAKDSNGNLPIHLAAMYGWADIVEVFVRAVAPERWPLPPLIPGKVEDNEPAEEPVPKPTSGEEDIFPADIRSLIQARSTEGETPLHHAAVNCKTQVIDYLPGLGRIPRPRMRQALPAGKCGELLQDPSVCAHELRRSIKLDGKRLGIYAPTANRKWIT